jgi:hypothetical protein
VSRGSIISSTWNFDSGPRGPRALSLRHQLGAQRLGVRGFGELAFVRGLDPTLGRDATTSPVRAAPGR